MKGTIKGQKGNFSSFFDKSNNSGFGEREGKKVTEAKAELVKGLKVKGGGDSQTDSCRLS